MSRPTYSRTGQRYLAHAKKKIVHDLDFEKEACDIHGILSSGQALSFIPDKLEQALYEGFQPCPDCLSSAAKKDTPEQETGSNEVEATAKA